MPLTISSMPQVLGYYRRLCRVKHMASAQRNRLSALSILREGLEEHIWLEALRHVQAHGELTSGMLSDALDVYVDVAATHLLNIWKEMVEVRGMPEEHIFLERRKVNLANGGREFHYRLSVLGAALMEDAADA